MKPLRLILPSDTTYELLVKPIPVLESVFL